MATAGSSTCPDCIKCDYNNAITSFPLQLSVMPSDSLYDSVDEPITMDFQWAARTTSPQFLIGTGQTDEASTTTGGSGAASTSTLRHNGTTYNLFSVQIAAASHKSWLNPPTLATSNTEDIIIVFFNGGSNIPTNYITVVVPILRTGSPATDPQYLKGLSAATATPGNYELSSCLPANSDGSINKKALFAYYVTCLDGYSQHKTPENMYVFVAVGGLAVSSSLMTALGRKVGAAGTFPPLSLPFLTHFANFNAVVGNREFTQYVMSTRHLLDFAGMASIYADLTRNERTDPTSAYTCVPLDPDKDVVDGNLKVDLDTGQVLTDVLAERNAARVGVGAPATPTATTSKVQKYIGIILGSICVFIIFCILLYFVFSLTSVAVPTSLYGLMGYSQIPDEPVDAAQPSATMSSPFLQNLPTYGIITIIAGVIGFTVGALIPS